MILPVVLVLASVLPFTTGALTRWQKDQCKRWHNYYRLMHRAPRLNLSPALEKKATKWANYLARNNKFEHESKDAGNLYASSTPQSNPCKVAVMAFYSEEKKYDYKKPGWSAQTGHFTQVVWKSTKFIGVAWVQRRDKKWVLVIKYSPLGNDGKYAQNVFPPRVATTKTPPTKPTTKRTTTNKKSTVDMTTVVLTTSGNTTWGNWTMNVNGTNSTGVAAVQASAKPVRVVTFSPYALGFVGFFLSAFVNEHACIL